METKFVLLTTSVLIAVIAYWRWKRIADVNYLWFALLAIATAFTLILDYIVLNTLSLPSQAEFFILAATYTTRWVFLVLALVVIYKIVRTKS